MHMFTISCVVFIPVDLPSLLTSPLPFCRWFHVLHSPRAELPHAVNIITEHTAFPRNLWMGIHHDAQWIHIQSFVEVDSWPRGYNFLS